MANEKEKGVYRMGFTLAVFTDIAGAFNNLSFEVATKAMKSKKISKEIRRWDEQYLQNRTSIMELKGIAKKNAIKAGYPQGGILSILLWSLAFDLLLGKFHKGRVMCIGFADDGTLLINGKDK